MESRTDVVPDDARTAAISRAARSAMFNGALPSTFRALITGTEVVERGYRRVAHEVERRTIKLAHTPAHGSRARDVQPLPNPGAVDPWEPDPAGLPEESACISTCPTCDGRKKVSCPACDGQGRLRCNDCRGRGKVQGQRGPKNCPACRGRGDVKCHHCRNGLVTCTTCAGIGRVRAWLEVRRQTRCEVHAHPQEGMAKLHKELTSAADFDRNPESYRIPLVHDTGWLERLPESVPPELQASLDARADRIMAQRSQMFRADVFRFAYGTRGSAGTIEVSGRPPGVIPGSNWSPLRRRFLLSLLAGIGSFVLTFFLIELYQSRAPWFREHGQADVMAAFGMLAALGGALAMAGLWLPRAVRSGMHVKLPLGLALVSWLVTGSLWFVGGPSPAGAQAAIARDDLAAARQEVDALQALGHSSDALREVVQTLAGREAEAEAARRAAADAAHLERVEAAPDMEHAVALLAEPWMTEAPELQARELVLGRAKNELEQRYEARDHEALRALAARVEALDPGLAQRARGLAALAKATECRTRQDFACAVAVHEEWTLPTDEPMLASELAQVQHDTEDALRLWLQRASFAHDEPTAQKHAIEVALANAELYRTSTGEPSPVSISSLRRKLARVERDIARAEARAAAAERRRKAAEARRARQEARRERRMRRQYAPLLCNDGTLSPSCTCGGSRRGCCSHHGGVAGCSQ